MSGAALELVGMLHSLAAYHGKRYCYPSQAWLLARWRRVTGRSRSRRTLNRHLAALEADGWIRRTCRHREQPGVGWCFRSTLYVMTARAWRWLASLRGPRARPRWSKPCAISGTQSTTPVVDHQGVATKPPWPPPPERFAPQIGAIRTLLLPKK